MCLTRESFFPLRDRMHLKKAHHWLLTPASILRELLCTVLPLPPAQSHAPAIQVQSLTSLPNLRGPVCLMHCPPEGLHTGP